MNQINIVNPGLLDRMPPSVFEQIIAELVGVAPEGYLQGLCGYQEPLKLYATVSKKWQPCIEKYTFCTVVLTSKDLLAGTAWHMLRGRLHHVRSIRCILFIEDLPISTKYQIANICAKMERTDKMRKAARRCW